jgi:hypothetical protein
MTTSNDPPGRRRRPAVLALLRPALVAVALLVVYYTLPLGRPVLSTLVAPVIGLVALSALITWQVLTVTRAPTPWLRAIEALSTTISLFVIMFATFYAALSSREPRAFTEPLDRTDALYFTVSTLATVGYGDIAAVSPTARIGAIAQMVAGLLLLGLVVQLFLRAVNTASRPGGPEGTTTRD